MIREKGAAGPISLWGALVAEELVYCEQTLSEEQSLFKCIYSMMLIIQISILLYKMDNGRNRVGSKQERGKERKRGAD